MSQTVGDTIALSGTVAATLPGFVVRTGQAFVSNRLSFSRYALSLNRMQPILAAGAAACKLWEVGRGSFTDHPTGYSTFQVATDAMIFLNLFSSLFPANASCVAFRSMSLILGGSASLLEALIEWHRGANGLGGMLQCATLLAFNTSRRDITLMSGVLRQFKILTP